MFVAPDGRLLGKLNSFKDFPDVHAGVSRPRGKDVPVALAKRSHVDVFLDYVAHHLGTQDRR
jgi:hypothetical protein